MSKYKCSVCGEIGHIGRTCIKNPAPKRCTVCKEVLPRTEFHTKNAVTVIGYCKKCARSKKIAAYETLDGRAKSIVSTIKQKRKKISPDFSVDYIKELFRSQQGLCAYTGLPMSVKRGPLAFSVDRVDNSKGYTKNNTVLCLWAINQMKHQHTLSFFKAMCAAVVGYEGPEKCI